MSKPGEYLKRLTARVMALLPQQWRGDAGRRFQETVAVLSEYSRQNVRIKEKLREAPDVAWEALKEKSSRALVNAAEEEQRRIDTQLARQTLRDRTRQERASAEKLESEARVSKINELQARLAFAEKLRSIGVVPVWDDKGNMAFVKAPASFEWEEMTSALLKMSEEQLEEMVKLTQPPDAVSE